MVRPPSIDSNGMKKGAWSEDEDYKLRAYIQRYGHWNWRLLPKFAGLQRCGKSCRLRWVNYLKPGVKRGNFTKEEQELVIKLHAQLGNKWSAIAEKLPGRTDNEIKNFWHTRVERRRKPNPALKPITTKASSTNLVEAKEYYSSPEAATSLSTSSSSSPSSSQPLDDNYPCPNTNAQDELDLMLSEMLDTTYSQNYHYSNDNLMPLSLPLPFPLLEDDFDYPELRCTQLSHSGSPNANNWTVDDYVCGSFWNESSNSNSNSESEITSYTLLQEEGLLYSDPLLHSFDYQTDLFC